MVRALFEEEPSVVQAWFDVHREWFERCSRLVRAKLNP